MSMIPWNSTKAKVQLRISVQRLRTLQEKKGAQAKASRRDIATLIERGRIETARVKVESIINEDIHIELLELLELYCELLIARFGLLDLNSREPDPAISEGVCSIIFSAPRTEVKELHVLRDILMHKYGREFSITVMENHDGRVSERVVRKLGHCYAFARARQCIFGGDSQGHMASPGRLRIPRAQTTTSTTGLTEM
ncbi:regulator of Vps4 activity in the MVB pathway-domain-containing protein [Armillaria mellea]|nr:regulator of Vps4 activity in the MVB pathway-domain-containing protein [Armillaria mellea]